MLCNTMPCGELPVGRIATLASMDTEEDALMNKQSAEEDETYLCCFLPMTRGIATIYNIVN